MWSIGLLVWLLTDTALEQSRKTGEEEVAGCLFIYFFIILATSVLRILDVMLVRWTPVAL